MDETNNKSKLIGARLRILRKHLGLSLGQLERLTDGKLKASAVGSYERGDRELTVNKLLELAYFYKTDLGTLVGEPTSSMCPRCVTTQEKLDRIYEAIKG